MDLVTEIRELERGQLIARLERFEAALEPFADLAGEGCEDYPDSEAVTVKVGRSTHYALTLGDLRRAARAYANFPEPAPDGGTT